MLWQEAIFFVAFLLLAGFTSFTVIDAVRRGIPFMRTQWVIYLQTFSAFIFILVFGLFIARIKGLYCFREIEEIQIFDRSQKTSLDYDSPAILEVYFEDIREYEAQSRYYKKSPYDRYENNQQSKLGTPLQKVRKLLKDIEKETDPASIKLKF